METRPDHTDLSKIFPPEKPRLLADHLRAYRAECGAPMRGHRDFYAGALATLETIQACILIDPVEPNPEVVALLGRLRDEIKEALG